MGEVQLLALPAVAVAAVVVADQAAKVLVFSRPAGRSIGPFWLLPALHAQTGPSTGWALVALAATTALVVHSSSASVVIAAAAAVGGAVSNHLDVRRRGAVRNCFALGALLAFNLADVAIATGFLVVAATVARTLTLAG